MVVAQLADSPSGHLVPIGGDLRAFVPDRLPRRLDMDSSLVYRLDEATRAVSILAGVGETIPNPYLLIAPFTRREAVLSSRIEGTQTSLSDLFLYEAAHRPTGDVLEVANYVRALDTGLELLDELPICVRLFNRVHSALLTGVRGEDKRPGEMRTTQVWLGSEGTPIEGARFIPPPPHLIGDSIADLEQFINKDLEMPLLVQCALMHYQFEAIHPYLDRNGRMGRLLIVLFLRAKRVLSTPLLYLSAYFERDRSKYYDQLFRVSLTGDWGAWLRYFLEGVAEQARDALARARQLKELRDKYRDLLQEKRESSNALRLVDKLFERPYMTTPLASSHLGVTSAGARGILDRLVRAGIVELMPAYWPRLFVATDLVEIVSAATRTDGPREPRPRLQ